SRWSSRVKRESSIERKRSWTSENGQKAKLYSPEPGADGVEGSKGEVLSHEKGADGVEGSKGEVLFTRKRL
ncbi:hypothetical protein, partial [Alkalihalobacillus trypoxylicola]|uniref:hypothetical protein n=1 Tax=Alkalihalobacillus trypoxylicola TaxID=519424 RepID=UPI000AA5B715